MTTDEVEAQDAEGYCCAMRRHFVLGIVGVRANEEMPTDMADYVMEWEPKLVISIHYCPFCGEDIDIDKNPLRIAT